MNRQLILLDQIIEMAEQQEEELKKYYIMIHKASKTLGDSALLFYLKALKDLIIEENKSVTPATPVVLDGKTYQVAVGDYDSHC